ncbi:glycosyltransferase [Dyadobacter sp. CY323]|uniref:glycosyltransferase family 2 protein n=1 Tax=Dyadobacter sp. CY323 TaxID=2907302 RepID=UPI001F2B8351|nr:glycosyltransferase [Dyadobacter sp. CY323]MCE6992753.1 glycosyltransferase [Dyadobacter sp. CY323]
MDKNLAIVIPAYKSAFFDAALASIAGQTNRRFTVYVGDDCSPENLQPIISSYESKINIVYKKFSENLGGNDLVAHWERCIEMTLNEEWIWLFSDDDIMEPGCVEAFYKTQEKNTDCDVFHFNIRIIGEAGETIKELPSYQKKITIDEFNTLKWSSKINSYVVEYIFRTAKYRETGRFLNFPHAWHSDEATWTKIGWEKGIVTISDAMVNWRRSSVNITPDTKSINIVKGKLNASIKFAEWVVNFYRQKGSDVNFKKRFLLAKRFVNYLIKCKPVLTPKESTDFITEQLRALELPYMYMFFLLQLKLKGAQ